MANITIYPFGTNGEQPNGLWPQKIADIQKTIDLLAPWAFREVTGDIRNYIQDGLVMHLDGINKGETSGRWSSLVGNSYATLTSHSTSNDDNIQMDGSGCLTVTNAVTTSYSSGTIEVCCDVSSSGTSIIYWGLTSKMAFIISSGGGYSFGITSSNNQWNPTEMATKFTASANSTRFMLNGVSGGTLTNNNWTGIDSTTIGGRGGNSSHYYATAKIYSIRIYNRKLTYEEMLHNQKVDNARFNLELTFNT